MCLPMMWKIIMDQIREEIYDSLTDRGLFPEEKKGCCKWTRSRRELLYIDQHILNETKKRQKNLAMAWIEYNCNMVRESWVLHYLKIYKIPKVVQFIEKKDGTWKPGEWN